MNQELINKGEKQFFDFVAKIGLKPKIKTPHTNTLEDLGKYEPEEEIFKVSMINLLYHEFFNSYIKEDLNYAGGELENEI